jgi:hypothetical protein
MAKPASLPRWSETVAGVPGANELEPTEGKKDSGYATGGDIPTSGGLNWWMRLVYKWLQWLDEVASPTMSTGWSTVATPQVRRAGRVSCVTISAEAGAGAAWTSICTVPEGFFCTASVFAMGTVLDSSTGVTHPCFFAMDGGTLRAALYDDGTAMQSMFVIGAGDRVSVTMVAPAD